MKILKNKKLLMSLSLVVGILLIMATAFADSINKSAYEQLKDSIKFTTFEMDKNVGSSTSTVNVILKDNDRMVFLMTTTDKSNKTGNMNENTTLTEYAGGKSTVSYHYNDDTTQISYDSGSDTYYVYEYTNFDSSYYGYSQENPFESEYARDVEKIFDAVVGNLRNYVTVTESPDGSKEFGGSLTDAQIPALINAIASFASKQYFDQSVNSAEMPSKAYDEIRSYEEYNDMSLPEMSGDISIKSVSGTAKVNADGIMDSIFITGVLTGKDKSGSVHDLSAEILIKIEDINSTVLTKPDLTGKNVVINKNEDIIKPTDTLSPKFVGAYKSDIILDSQNELVKIGERLIVITEISGANVKGNFTETYFAGYEDRYDDMSEFDFEAESSDPFSLYFQFTDKSGNLQTANMYFDPNAYTIQFYLDARMNKENSTYSRIFD